MAKEQAPWVKAAGLFGVIVADIVGYTAAGFGLGYLLWKKAGAPEWIIVIPTLAGFGLAMYKLYRLSQKL